MRQCVDDALLLLVQSSRPGAAGLQGADLPAVRRHRVLQHVVPEEQRSSSLVSAQQACSRLGGACSRLGGACSRLGGACSRLGGAYSRLGGGADAVGLCWLQCSTEGLLDISIYTRTDQLRKIDASPNPLQDKDYWTRNPR